MAERHRDYDKEYREYQGTPEQIRNRAERNQARAIMKKRLGAAAIAGKDIDHIRMIDKGGTNAISNLRVSTIRDNRDWRKGQKGRP